MWYKSLLSATDLKALDEFKADPTKYVFAAHGTMGRALAIHAFQQDIMETSKLSVRTDLSYKISKDEFIPLSAVVVCDKKSKAMYFKKLSSNISVVRVTTSGHLLDKAIVSAYVDVSCIKEEDTVGFMKELIKYMGLVRTTLAMPSVGRIYLSDLDAALDVWLGSKNFVTVC